MAWLVEALTPEKIESVEIIIIINKLLNLDY